MANLPRFKEVYICMFKLYHDKEVSKTIIIFTRNLSSKYRSVKLIYLSISSLGIFGKS